MPETGRGPAPEAGRPDVLAPGLVRVTAANPGMMTGPGTNTYLVGSGDVAVVDPGPDDAAHRRAVLSAAESAGGRVRWVLVTHTHADHAPGAGPLAGETGATIVGFGARDGFSPDLAVADGWELQAPSFRLRAVHTPGHAGDHVCWLLDEPRILLSGDHVMHGATVVIRPPDGDMATYLASLRRVGAIDPPLEAIAPGHGRLIADPASVVAGIIAHRLAREEVVAAALEAAGAATVDELAAVVYADVDPSLLPVARFSLWAHLRKLVDDGRARVLTEAPADPVATRPAGRHANGQAPDDREPVDLGWTWAAAPGRPRVGGAPAWRSAHP